MAVIKLKPTSPGRRAQVKVVHSHLHKGKPEASLLEPQKQNQVLFKVLRDATKPEIKAAVELMFKVEVASVTTSIQKGKVKRFGRTTGRRDHVKKAFVALKPGQELNFSGEAA